MQQWLSNLGSPDLRGPWLIVIAAVAALLILYFLYRFVFGHRLRVPAGGRTRQPRLGLVDAFSLDGQRQLVLVRRDNVEHLIMIGGPTDVLVESQIIRVSAPTSAAATREREVIAPVKAPPAAPPAPVASPVIASPAPAPPERPVLPAAAAAVAAPPQALSPPARPPQSEGPQPRIPKPTPAVQAEPALPPRGPEPAPKSKEIAPTPKPKEVSPAPQRPAAPVRRDMGVVASAVIGSDLEASTVKPIKPSVAPISAPAKPSSQRPTLPPPIGAQAATTRSSFPAQTREAPAASAAKPQPAAVTAAPAPRAAKAPDAFADLESLEAEMARLLGRDV